MGSKNQRLSVPQPGNPPSPAAVNGGKAFTALSNHAQAIQNATGGTGTATAGSLYSGGLAFTPKVSGKVLVMWSAAGAGSNITANATFTPSIGSFTGPAESSGVGAATAAGGPITAGGQFIASGLAVGVPVTANIAYASNNGFTQASQGSLVLIELPA